MNTKIFTLSVICLSILGETFIKDFIIVIIIIIIISMSILLRLFILLFIWVFNKHVLVI